jgi:hypothetical protein
MVTSMTTTDTLHRPATRWEPCVTFRRDDAEDGICVDCGWLREEHAAFDGPPD